MIKQNNLYCVILAGGKGKRLWPVSRHDVPKQFIDFFGTGQTQLQQTYNRFASIMPQENIFISTHSEYVNIVKQQIPNIHSQNILDEPIRRDTAPSVAWATYRISKINNNANVIVSPSDQGIFNDEAFKLNINEAIEFINQHNNNIVAVGIKPSRPEPGYGYIQTAHTIGDNVYSVKSFTEKPNREFAQMFVDSGEFVWNTGLFVARSSTLLQCLYTLLPPVLRELEKQNPQHTKEQEREFLETHYSEYPNMPLDRTLLEHATNVVVLKGCFGWADLGTWHSIYEEKQQNNNNVVLNSDVIIENSKNCIIKLPKGKLAIINGLDGFIVAENNNVVLICKKEDSSALIRKYVTEVQVKKGDKFV